MREPGWYWVKLWSNYSKWVPRYCDGGETFYAGTIEVIPTVVGPKIEEPKEQSDE